MRRYATLRALFSSLVFTSSLGAPFAHQAVFAGPEGGEVIGGDGTITYGDDTTTILQESDSLAIDWDSFDVGSDESVLFIQPDSDSVALNNILSNHGSTILGQIDANGHVILVNPNGVIFGAGSVVNAGGILASGLRIDPDAFMNGDYVFSAVDGSNGFVLNQGLINAAMGGSVALIGQQVENEGVISAQLGAVTLAAGKEAVVTFDEAGLLGVTVTEAVLQDDIGVDAAVINSGEISAENGQVLLTASVSQDIFSAAVNTGEIRHATSVVVDEDGSFTLSAGSNVESSGSINVSGSEGGSVVVLGENVNISGDINADSTEAETAGFIEVHSQNTSFVEGDAVISADAGNGSGGDIKLLGNNVGVIETALVSASGETGGGQLLVGGDETGSNPRIRNSEFIYIGEGVQLNADAFGFGDGGKLIAFAEGTARIYGQLSATGGSFGGNGGFIETSGLRGFEILNTPDITADNGDGGHWLIDPYNITIFFGDVNIDNSGNDYFALSNGAFINVSTLRGALVDQATVTLTTTTPDPDEGEGNISLSTPLENMVSSGAATLILNAHGTIDTGGRSINACTTGGCTSSLNLVLNANYENFDGNVGNVLLGSSVIDTNGGYIALNGENIAGTFNGTDTYTGFAGSIDTGGGNFYVGVATAAPTDGPTGSFPEADSDPGGEVTGIDVITGAGTVTADPIDGIFWQADSSTIRTRSNTGGGDIIINTTGDVTLGILEIGDLNGTADTLTNAEADLSVTSASGSITLAGNFYYREAGDGNINNDFVSNLTFNAGTDVTINSDVIIDNRGTPTNPLNMSLIAGGNINYYNTGDSGVQNTWLGNGTFLAQAGGNVTIGEGSDSTGTVDTEGGSFTIYADGAVAIETTVRTRGGDFIVGDGFDAEDTFAEPSSFTNLNGVVETDALFGTSSDGSNNDPNHENNVGGAITIYSDGDVTLGTLSNSRSGIDSTEVSGAITVYSGNDITLSTAYDFNDTANGTTGDLAAPTFTTLSFYADNNITISAEISDSIAANVGSPGNTTGNQDTLNINLEAGRSGLGGVVNIDADIYTAGGNVTISGDTYDSTGQTINTGFANSSQYGWTTTGGDVQITSTNAALTDTDVITLGSIYTEGGFSQGDLVLISNGNIIDASGAVLTINGNLIVNTDQASDDANLGNVTLDNDNDFLGEVHIVEANNFTLNDLDLDTGDGVNTLVLGSALGGSLVRNNFVVTTDGNIADAGAITVTGTSSLTAGDYTIVLDDAHDFGGAVSVGSVSALTLNDVNDLVLGDITVNSSVAETRITAGGAITQPTGTDDIVISGIDIGNTSDDTADHSLYVEATSVQLNNVSTTGNDNDDGGAITITATAGSVSLGVVSSDGGTATQGDSGRPGRNAGNITINADTEITVSSISAAGSTARDNNNEGSSEWDGGNGGNVILASTTSSVTVGAISTIGGNGDARDSGGNEDNDDADGGDAGTIEISANAGSGNIVLNGDLTSSAGHLFELRQTSSDRSHGTSGAITLTGNVLLNEDVMIDATLVASPDNDTSEDNVGTLSTRPSAIVTINGTVDGDDDANNESLTIRASDVYIRGNVGQNGLNGELGDFEITITDSTDDAEVFFQSVDALTQYNLRAQSFTLNQNTIAPATNTDVWFVAGDIDTSSLNGTSNAGIISIDSDGIVSLGNLNASGATADVEGLNGNDITINGTNISIASINASGSDGNDVATNNGGNSGAVVITATENDGTPSITLSGDVNTQAGEGVVDGTETTARVILAGTGSAVGTATLELGSAFYTSSFDLEANTSSDTLVGPEVTGATYYWNTTSDNGGTLAIVDTITADDSRVTFTGLENIQAGEENDIVTITHAINDIALGNGANQIIFASGANVTGTVNGGSGVDTFDVISDIAARLLGNGGNDIFNISANVDDGDVGTLDVVGGDDDDDFNILASGVTASIDGSGNVTDGDDLNAFDDPSENVSNRNVWVINSDGSHTLTNNSGVISFTNVENLNGGDEVSDGMGGFTGGVDQFTLNASPTSLGLTIDAGSADDSILYTDFNNAYQLSFTSFNEGISNVETIQSDAENDGQTYTLELVSIASPNTTTNTWTVTSANTGTVTNGEIADPINFEGFAILYGNEGDDSFTVNDGASITSVSGVRSDGVLDTSNNEQNSLTVLDTAENIWALTAVFEGNVDARNFYDIQTITGSGNDTLNALDQRNDWTIDTISTVSDTDDATNDVVTFSGFGTLVGRSNIDTFNINTDFSGTINAGDLDDQFNIDSEVSGSLNGEAGTDTFTILAGGSVTGSISGGTSDDLGAEHLDEIEGLTTEEYWTISGANAGAVGSTLGASDIIASFTGIESVNGRGGDDQFNFTSPTSILTTLSGGTGSDRVRFDLMSSAVSIQIDESLSGTGDYRLSGVEWIVGTNEGDAAFVSQLTYVSATDEVVAWNVDDYDDVETGFYVVDGINDGQVEGVNFVNFDTLNGDAGDDTFTLSTAADTSLGYSITGTINAGDGDDVLEGRDVVTTWNITGDGQGTFTNVVLINDDDPMALVYDDIASFTGVETVNGALTLVDTFQIGSTDYNITLNGRGGANVAQLPGGDVDISIGTSIETGVGLENISTLRADVGSTSILRFAGDGNNETDRYVDWQITGDDIGTVGYSTGSTTSFENFTILIGSAEDDQFTIGAAGTVSGIVGVSVSDLADERIQSGEVNTIVGRTTGTAFVINGEDPTNFDVDAPSYNGQISSVVSGFAYINALDGSDTSADSLTVSSAGNYVGSFDAGTGTGDAISIASVTNYDNEWAINGGIDATHTVARVNGATTTTDISFTGAEQIAGGSLVDVFEFTTVTAFNGSDATLINAGDGSDTVDLSSIATSETLNAEVNGATVSVSNATPTAIYAVQNVENFEGNNSENVTLQITDTTEHTISFSNIEDGVNDGQYGSFTFYDVASVQGGTGATTFEILDNGIANTLTFDGTLDGNGGTSNELQWQEGGLTWTLSETVDYEGTASNAVGSVSFENIHSLVGAGDTLIGKNQNNDWQITGANSGSVGLYVDGGSAINPILFAGMSSLSGNVNADYFTRVDNASAADGSISGTIRGTYAGGSDGADDVLIYESASTQDVSWVIGDTTDSVGDINNFIGVETFNGGNGNDTFTIHSASISITVDGGGDGTTGDVLALDETDYASDATWTIDGDAQQQVVGTGTVLFSDIETAQGGSGVDTFNITGESVSLLMGRSGNDIFDVQTTSAVNIGVDGGDGTEDELLGADIANVWNIGGSGTIENTLNYVSDSALGVEFSNVEYYIGGSNTDDFTIQTAGRADVIRGSVEGVRDSAIDTITVDRSSGTTTWTITAEGTGSVSNNYLDNFYDVESIVGGSTTDIFNFTTTASEITGLIDGAGGTNDQITFASDSPGIVVEVGPTVTPENPDTTDTLVNLHVNNIESITATAIADESDNWLVNNTSGDFTWSIASENNGTLDITADAGSFNDISFFNFGYIQGSDSGADTFDFATGGSISGMFVGGTGTNVQDEANFADVDDEVAINLGAGSSSAINFEEIELVVGNNDGSISTLNNSILTVESGTNAWTITDLNDGEISNSDGVDIAFENFNQIVGGTDGDTFTFEATGFITGTINGGTNTNSAINDLVIATALTSAETFRLIEAESDAEFGSINIQEIEELQASTQSNTLVAAATGNYDWTVNNTNAGYVGAEASPDFEFSGISEITGNDNVDTFTVDTAGSINILNGEGEADQFYISGSVTTINGGTGSDVLTIENIAAVVGDFNAGADETDEIVLAYTDASATPVTAVWTIDTDPSVSFGSGSVGFNDVETVNGSAYVDQATITSDAIDTFYGLNGEDVITLNAGAVITTVEGGNGDDSITANAGTITNISGNAGDDDITTSVNVANIDGGSDTTDGDTLTIESATANTVDWAVSSANAGSVSGDRTITSFSNIEHIEGGDGTDNFTVSANIDSINGAGGSDEFTIADASVTTTIDGSESASDNDEVTLAYNANATWTIQDDGAATPTETSNVVATGGGTVSFTNIETLNGSEGVTNAVDTFNVNATYVDVINARAGDDFVNINEGGNVSTINGGDGNDQFNLEESIGIVNGDAGSDTLSIEMQDVVVGSYNGGADDTDVITLAYVDAAATPVVAIWTIDDTPSVTYGTGSVSFADIETANGSSYIDQATISSNAIDTFNGLSGEDVITINSGATIVTVSGGADSDSITANGGSVTNINGGDGDDDITTSVNVTNIDGGNADTAGDTLTVVSAVSDTNAWTVSSVNAGNVSGDLTINSFTDIENLMGGEGSDNFAISANVNTIDGGNGEDSFNIFVSTVSTTINGNNDNDTFTLSYDENAAWTLETDAMGAETNQVASASGGIVQFSNIETINGVDGSSSAIVDSFDINSQTLVTSINGRAGADEFNIAVSIDAIDGGADGDLFTIENSEVSIATLVGGNSGIDALELAYAESLTDPITANWVVDTDPTVSIVENQGEATEVTLGEIALSGIEVAMGSGGEDVFTITSSNISTLEGGNGNDSFTLESGDIETINAGAGSDSIVLNGGSINLVEGGAGIDSITTSIDINALIGGSEADTLTLVSTSTNTWDIDGANQGNVSGDIVITSFIEIENLTGGEGVDQFTLSSLDSIIDGLIDGGESSTQPENDADILTLSGLTNGVLVELGPTAGTGSAPVEGRSVDITVVNANNFEQITAAAGTNESEAGNWIGITHGNSLVWDFTEGLNADGSNNPAVINEGLVFEQTIVDSQLTTIENSTVNLSNFGSLQGGAGANESPINVIPGETISGNYVPGSGERILTYSGTGLVIVDIDRNIVEINGNNNLLLRTADGSEFYTTTNHWLIDSVNAGTFTGASDSADPFSFDFTGVNQFEGGEGNDTFEFAINTDNVDMPTYGQLINGAINGGAGENSILVGAVEDPLAFGMSQTSLVAATPSAIYPETGIPEAFLVDQRALNDGVTEIVDIATIDALAATNETITLVGYESGSYVWNLNQNNSTIADSTQQTIITFNGIDRMLGAGANDTVFVNVIGASGSIFDGGEGTDVLHLTPLATALDVVVYSDLPASIISVDDSNNPHVANFETVYLPNETNTLFAGGDLANTWEINGSNLGTLQLGLGVSAFSVDFNNAANLVGGANVDIFNITAGEITGTINGGDQPLNTVDVINVSASGDRVYQLATLDGNGDVANSSDAVLDIYGIEELNANDAASNTLRGLTDADNTWLVSAAVNTVNGIEFSNIENIVGGSLQDLFTFNGNYLTGLIDGGDSAGDALDTLTLTGNISGVSLHLGNRVTGDINIVGIETINSSVNIPLIADDVENNWVITNVGSGTIGTAIEFNGFMDLVGGSDDDNFSFMLSDTFDYSQSIINSIDGGAQPITGNSNDVIDFAGWNDALMVSFDTAYANADLDLTIANVEDISANAAYANVLVGFDSGNTWTIDSDNGGDINGIFFAGFQNLIGRNGDDSFVFTTSGSLDGSVVGGAEVTGDVVDVSDLNTVNIVISDSEANGYDEIERYRASGSDATLTAPNARNEWLVDGAVVETIDGEEVRWSMVRSGTDDILFTGFDTLVGGNAIDSFVLSYFEDVTTIDAGEGNDLFDITVDTSADIDLYVVGGVGTIDQIDLYGGSETNPLTGEYRVNTSGDEVITFEQTQLDSSVNTFALRFNTVESVDNNVDTTQFIVNDISNNADIIVVNDASFQVNDLSEIGYANSSSLSIDAQADDLVIIDGTVAVDSVFTVSNAAVEGSDETALINAGSSIVFNGTQGVGVSADERLNTQTTALSLNNIDGNVYIDQNGTLTLSALTATNATVDLYVDGNVTSTATLESNGLVSIAIEDQGAISLTNENNQLTGALRFINPDGAVELVNGATNLQEVLADSLTLTSNLNISDSGVIEVGGTTTITGSNTTNIVFDSEGNDFGTFVINNANSATINDDGDAGITMRVFSLLGALQVDAVEDIQTNVITANSVSLASENGTVTINNAMTSNRFVDIEANGVNVNADITVSDNQNNYAVDIDARNDALGINANIDATGTTNGNVYLTAGIIDQSENANIDGNNVTLVADQNIVAGPINAINRVELTSSATQGVGVRVAVDITVENNQIDEAVEITAAQSTIEIGAAIDAANTTNGDVVLTANSIVQANDVIISGEYVWMNANQSIDAGPIQAENRVRIEGEGVDLLGAILVRNNQLDEAIYVNAGDLDLTIQGNLTSQNETTGNVELIADTINQFENTVISGVNVTLEAQQNVIADEITANNFISITGASITLNDAITVADNGGVDAVFVSATDALNILGAITANGDLPGNIELSGESITQARNASIRGGDVTLTANTSINIAESIQAVNTFEVTNADTFDMFGAQADDVITATDLIITTENDMNLRTLNADTITLTSRQGDINFLNDTVANGQVVINALNGHLNQTVNTELASETGDITIDSNTAEFNGLVEASNGTIDIETSSDVVLTGMLNSQDLVLDALGQVEMSLSSSIVGNSSVEIKSGADFIISSVSTTAEDGYVDLDIEGAVIDSNGTLTNIETVTLSGESETGFGSRSGETTSYIETSVSSVDFSNTSGVLALENDRALSVEHLLSNGRVDVVVTEGNLTLVNPVGENIYDRGLSDAKEAGGVINANYMSGSVNIDVQDGRLEATGVRGRYSEPDIVGDAMVIRTTEGFGTDARPLMVYARTSLFIRGTGYYPQYAFQTPPSEGLKTDQTLAENSSILIGGSDLVLEVESVDEIDAAVFTEVRNYSFDNISILMPRDQRYDDDEDDYNEDDSYL